VTIKNEQSSYLRPQLSTYTVLPTHPNHLEVFQQRTNPLQGFIQLSITPLLGPAAAADDDDDDALYPALPPGSSPMYLPFLARIGPGTCT
jgi:hypothetical protein